MNKKILLILTFFVVFFAFNIDTKAATKFSGCYYTIGDNCVLVITSAVNGKKTDATQMLYVGASNNSIDISYDGNKGYCSDKYRSIFTFSKNAPKIKPGANVVYNKKKHEQKFLNSYYKNCNKSSCSKKNNSIYISSITTSPNEDDLNVRFISMQSFSKSQTGWVAIKTKKSPQKCYKNTKNILGTAAKDYKAKKLDKLTAIEIKDNLKSCEQILSKNLLKQLKYVYIIIKIIVPILLVILTMLDFTQAIASSEEDALNKAKTKFIKRAGIALAIFLTPDLINFIFNVTGMSDGTCGIS